LAITATAVIATPALAKSKHHPHAVNSTQGLYLQAPYVGQAPSEPGIMVKGKMFTDPDMSIRNYLIRTYREEGTG
jgi:hypothetical protein